MVHLCLHQTHPNQPAVEQQEEEPEEPSSLLEEPSEEEGVENV